MILVVEDEFLVRELVTDSLKTNGYQVVEACDGKDAREKMKHCGQHIDLILTDIVMPGISGKQLVAELSKIQPKVKSLFMSGYSDDAALNQGGLSDQVEFIQKPFSPASLVRKVQEILGE